MKYIGKIIIIFLVLAISYLGYGLHYKHQKLLSVYDTPDKYAITPVQYDLTIVDFNKYSCDQCQSLHPVLMEAIKRDGKVRYIPRNITNGYGWNNTLAIATYAAGEQGKFMEMYNMIYEKWPVEDKKTLFRYAKSIGINTQKLSRDMSNPEIKILMMNDQNHFKAWKLRQTPSLLIGEKSIYTPGKETPNIEKLLDMFEGARL